MPNSSALLLDTHCWLWLAAGAEEQFSAEIRDRISEAARDHAILISAISVWEVATLESKGRIQLAGPCLEWVQDALASPGISLIPLSPEIAIESTRLPGEFHSDPADRILVATARLHHATLLTADRRILDYTHRHHMRARAPR